MSSDIFTLSRKSSLKFYVISVYNLQKLSLWILIAMHLSLIALYFRAFLARTLLCLKLKSKNTKASVNSAKSFSRNTLAYRLLLLLLCRKMSSLEQWAYSENAFRIWWQPNGCPWVALSVNEDKRLFWEIAVELHQRLIAQTVKTK